MDKNKQTCISSTNHNRLIDLHIINAKNTKVNKRKQHEKLQIFVKCK